MIVGAIDISGMQSPGGGAVPYLEAKHQTGMKLQYHLDISHARHLKPWLGHNFQLLAVCKRIWNLYGRRTKGERATLARETIGKRVLGGGAQTKSDFNFVKRIVLKFEMVKNVTLVG